MTRKIKIKTKNDEANIRMKRHKWLAVILKENKGTILKWISTKKDTFRVDGNTYFCLPEGVYMSDNRILLTVYLEGVSTPFTHANIEKEIVEREFELNGELQTTKITMIKGLKYDSEVIDMILSRRLADEFTKQHFDLPMIILIILILVSVGFSIANLGVLLS